MSMTEWARKEVEIACAREKAYCEKDSDSIGWEYGCACYESALKAYKSLMEDDHSGFSISLTKNILVRLIEGKPLTPIEDTPDIWNLVHRPSDIDPGETKYQCSRMSSLFKTVHADGSVTFDDINRVRVTYAGNPEVWWSNGNVTRLIDEMYPITMPYVPDNGVYAVYAEEFLVDPANGDYDTVGYLYVKTPSGDTVELNRYFKDDPTPGSCALVEIGFEEYCERKQMANERK